VDPRPDEPTGSEDPKQPDPDAAFRAIVEGYGRASEAPVPPWPVEEDVEPERRRSDGDEPRPRRRTDPPSGPGLPGWVEPAPIDDESHYIPPPPPPAPRLRPRSIAAVGAVLLGLVLLFVPSLLDVARGPGSYFLGMVMAGGGAGALVYWMRDAPGVDDGPDDGAVV
jgi:hypothetical protein